MSNANGIDNNSDSQDAQALDDRSILVLYGTETGNSHEIAEHLGRRCQRLHFHVLVEEMDDIKLVRVFIHSCAATVGWSLFNSLFFFFLAPTTERSGPQLRPRRFCAFYHGPGPVS